MVYADRADAKDLVSYDVEILKEEYEGYYNCLCIDDLHPVRIIFCSELIVKKEGLLKKVILIYENRIIVLKEVNGSISKNIVKFSDINYIVKEGMPNPSCITIFYKSEGRERIFFDTGAEHIVNSFLYDLRTFLTGIQENKNIPIEDLNESDYIDAVIKKSLLENQKFVCCLKQRRIYNRYFSVFRKIITQYHFTAVCDNEIIIFLEKHDSEEQNAIFGDLIYIPVCAIKNISLESTDKGMIMRYLFYTNKKFKLFYENEKTDELLKIMSFINGAVTK